MYGEVPPPPETPEVAENPAQEAVDKATVEVGDKDISQKFDASGESAESSIAEEEQLAEEGAAKVEELSKGEQVKEGESIDKKPEKEIASVKDDSEHKINWNETNNESPDKLDLGDRVNNQMNELYEKTEADGNERAGTFVSDSNGDLEIDPNRIVTGDHNSVIPDYGKPEDIGTVHTHPEGSPPSDVDISSAINSGEKLSVVDAGDTVYALKSTENTAKEVDTLGVNLDYYDKVAKHLDDGHTWEEAQRYANIELADAYGLDFYEGKPNGELNRIESSKI